MRNRLTTTIVIACSLLFPLLYPTLARSNELILGVANSTCPTMQKAAHLFTEKTGIKLKLLCQPTGLLAQGIKEGALDIDYFLSANEKWMNEVSEEGLIKPMTIRKHWGNTLVVASLPLKSDEVKLQRLTDLTKPEVKQILIGDPTLAPYGQYAKEALMNAGIWNQVLHKIKYNKKISKSVRTLKKYGLSRTGVVALLYQTNTRGNLLNHFEIPQNLYSHINYFCAPLIKSKHQAELRQFITFIDSPEANRIFAAAGFVVYPTMRGSL